MSLLFRTTTRTPNVIWRLTSLSRRNKALVHNPQLSKKWEGTLTRRLLSSNSNIIQTETSKSTNQTPDNDDEWSLLYARSPSRSTTPRVSLAFTTFNSLYWLWYTLDFTPSVNAAAYEKAALNQIDAETLKLLLVDPAMGFVGLGMALLFLGGSVWYPKHLIGGIWKSGDKLAVSTMKMPFITIPPVINQSVNNSCTDSELRSDSNTQVLNAGEISIVGERETNEILVKLDGDLGKKRGFLALQVKNPDDSSDSNSAILSLLSKKNYLLDISEEEIMDGANADLVKMLLLAELEGKQSGSRRRQKNKTADETHIEDEKHVQIRPKFGKKKK